LEVPSHWFRQTNLTEYSRASFAKVFDERADKVF